VSELLPIVSGLCLGSLLVLVRPRTRPVVAVAASIVLGTLATVASGEFRTSWDFLLIDIPLVAFFTCVGFFVTRRVRPTFVHDDARRPDAK
jgi:dolichyl-phosphate-mannose--protein O-mannosyl transferase